MSLSVAPLLVHLGDVPVAARTVVRAALAAPEPARQGLLALAARILHREAAIDCSDALELVGLPAGGC